MTTSYDVASRGTLLAIQAWEGTAPRLGPIRELAEAVVLLPLKQGPVVLATRDARFAAEVAMALEGLGARAPRLTTVDNIPDCIVAIRLLDPSVVLLDDGLAEKPGAALLHQVQQVRSGAAVVYVASQHTLDLEREVRRQGVLFYIARPEEHEVLQSVLGSILQTVVRRSG